MFVPCQVLDGRRGFWRISITSGTGMLPERQVYCVFLPETNPDFKKQKEWCFIYFCILQQSFFFMGFIWLFLLIQLFTILARVFLSLRWWPLIIIHLRNSKLNYNSIHLGVIQVCMATAIDILHSDKRLTSSPLKGLPFSEVIKFFHVSSGTERCPVVTEWFCNGKKLVGSS